MVDGLLALPGRWGTTSRASRACAAAVALGLLAVGASAGVSALSPAPAATSSSADRTAAVAARAGSVRASSSSSTSSSSSQAAAAVPAPTAVPLSAGLPSTVPAPTALRIPSLGVSSPLVRLGIRPDGSLEVPADAQRAGWFAQGVAPGGVGPAVIAGHVDSRTGPGVFAHLAGIGVGALVEVGRADGSTAEFVVTSVQQVAKDAFPTQSVYGPVAGPELRLITCGGAFDQSTGHYVDNVVVYARQAQTTTS
ncbi:class F sortase [Quadrisphaera oryzae]|uniref:class F sortase n=1 Tax=Quadrisphaera oryzae TaxID=2509661 RepID=UPI001647AFBB|nr:class F sortase [Quadrisphaera sp. RL12-1S]